MRKDSEKYNIILTILMAVFIFCLVFSSVKLLSVVISNKRTEKTLELLAKKKEAEVLKQQENREEEASEQNPFLLPSVLLRAGVTGYLEDDSEIDLSEYLQEPEILKEYQSLYEKNPDIIGWLKIPDMRIDYPVMQTLWDEEYYLYKDFDGNENNNGSLLMDTDSEVGVGTVELGYYGGVKPSTNLIIHGHNMKSGLMFGDLDLYREESFEQEHSTILFDSLYEHREYEVFAVILSKAYYPGEEGFRYYAFFNAGNEEEYNSYVEKVQKLALYDTGVVPVYGEELLTLSTCAYHTKNGRLAVIARRVK